ncbi:MAG: 3-hydroxyacyl-CoA dehydrogenase NAD-binding domain-containing protein [Polyangiales bacterium]
MAGRFEVRNEIGIIFIDNPPVNAISKGVREALIDGAKQLAANPALKAGVIACVGRTFMAGADITEFGKPPLSPSLPEAIAVLESSDKPIVAALHGTALGGGFEVALGVDYRVALATAAVGLPEVKLGILPGAGGTQRLPRLIGVEKALDLIVAGDPVPAPAALKLGVIDQIVEGDLLEGAIKFAEELVKAGKGKRKVRDLSVAKDSLAPGFFDEAKKRFAKEKKNLFAPQRIVEAVQAAVELPFDQGLAKERDLFIACQQNSQSKALQHVFFAERQAANIPNLPKGTKTREIKSVGIIGAGTMGGGIAMNFANVGIKAIVLEVKQEYLDKGLGVVRKNYENTFKKGKLTQQQFDERLGLIQGTLDYNDFANVDLVIEAVFETMAIKKEVFTKLDEVCKPGAILASNTSYLSIDEIADTTKRPGDVVGLHFFSPANVMRLLEIVRGEKTSPDVLATSLELAKKIKKVGVVAGNRNGFIGNRMLSGYGYHAQVLLLEGVKPEQIDGALRAFGMPMGPLQMGDLAGLDIGYKSRKDRDPSTYDGRATKIADLLVEAGRLGQKTGGGYYDYAPGDRTPRPSPVVQEIIDKVAKESGFAQRTYTDEEIVQRVLLPLMNVGADVLDEGVAYRASDIDIVYLNGYGFPAYRGGPMFWAENEVGLEKALAKIKEYSAIVGEKWTKPSPLLERLVAEKKGFSQA